MEITKERVSSVSLRMTGESGGYGVTGNVSYSDGEMTSTNSGIVTKDGMTVANFRMFGNTQKTVNFLGVGVDETAVVTAIGEFIAACRAYKADTAAEA